MIQNEQHVKRGKIDEDDLLSYQHYEISELLQMLSNRQAKIRSIAIRLIGQQQLSVLIKPLIECLAVEKALYTKIELQSALTLYGAAAVPLLIKKLGSIGKNQHISPNNDDINKKSFPLARDIAARVLSQIGLPALPYLHELLLHGSCQQKMEAIDAIGHISCNHKNLKYESSIIELYQTSGDNQLLRWKLIKVMQAFKHPEIVNILKKIIDHEQNDIFVKEAMRSLDRIKGFYRRF